MTGRARHEARWTHAEATVRGTHRNRGWVLLVGFAALVTLSTVAYMEFMRFETVSYELRQCERPLSESSSWADVEAAGCEPVTLTDAADLVVVEAATRSAPDRVDGSTWVFDEVPVNSPAHAVELVTPVAGQSVVIAEPTNRVVRDEMSTDASGTRWTGFIGSRGPTEYWLLVTPAQAG
jgi:hypothetical protein